MANLPIANTIPRQHVCIAGSSGLTHRTQSSRISCMQRPNARSISVCTTANRLPSCSLFTGGRELLGLKRLPNRIQRSQVAVQARRGGDDVLTQDPNKNPPNIFWKVAASLFYLIPWIDVLALGRDAYHCFPSSLPLYFLPRPFVNIYYSSQFAPLIIFFLLFLSIVKNTKLPHFVRWNCMQSVMLDIVGMLFNILRGYMPAELRWSVVLTVFDKFSWNICMCTVVYCVFFSLWGKYADIPYISDAAYQQVEQSEYS